LEPPNKKQPTIGQDLPKCSRRIFFFRRLKGTDNQKDSNDKDFELSSCCKNNNNEAMPKMASQIKSFVMELTSEEGKPE